MGFDTHPHTILSISLSLHLEIAVLFYAAAKYSIPFQIFILHRACRFLEEQRCLQFV